MILTDKEILEIIEKKEMGIENMSRDCLEPASYDVRLGEHVLRGGEAPPENLREKGSIAVRPGEFIIFTTYEKFRLPNIISGHLGAKSYFVQRGLILLSGHHIDPGFDGFLLMGAYNASPRNIVVAYRDKICNVEFHKLACPPEKHIREFPELRTGDIPRTARDYFANIEPVALHDLNTTVSKLAENVSALTTDVRALTRITYMVILPILGVICAAGIIRLLGS